MYETNSFFFQLTWGPWNLRPMRILGSSNFHHWTKTIYAVKLFFCSVDSSVSMITLHIDVTQNKVLTTMILDWLLVRSQCGHMLGYVAEVHKILQKKFAQSVLGNTYTQILPYTAKCIQYSENIFTFHTHILMTYTIFYNHSLNIHKKTLL